MLRPLSLSLPLALLAAVTAPAALAVEVTQAWARATPPGSTLSAAFMQIRNESGQADRLLGAHSDAAGRVEIHETRMQGDVMQMRELEDGLDLPAGASVSLEPGGLHLMLLDLPAPLLAGESLLLQLKFEQAGNIEVPVEIRAPGANDKEDEHAHHGHHHH